MRRRGQSAPADVPLDCDPEPMPLLEPEDPADAAIPAARSREMSPVDAEVRNIQSQLTMFEELAEMIATLRNEMRTEMREIRASRCNHEPASNVQSTDRAPSNAATDSEPSNAASTSEAGSATNEGQFTQSASTEAQATAAPVNAMLTASAPICSNTPSNSLPPQVAYVINRETIPLFKAEVPASRPLQRNQEIESWIRHIENLTHLKTDAAFIQAARAHCRGTADLVINSSLFDPISDWQTFKGLLREKFRGTCSSADFFRMLYAHSMVAGQTPLDLYVQLQGAVYQGVRDYPKAVGDPDELIRRVFMQALPTRVKEIVAVHESDPMPQLAAAAQQVWNAQNGAQYPTARGPTQIPLGPQQEQEVAATTARQGNKWCQLHRVRSHNTSECRTANNRSGNQGQGNRYYSQSYAMRRCYTCGDTGHLARDCPFSDSQREQAPAATGTSTDGGQADTE